MLSHFDVLNVQYRMKQREILRRVLMNSRADRDCHFCRAHRLNTLRITSVNGRLAFTSLANLIKQVKHLRNSLRLEGCVQCAETVQSAIMAPKHSLVCTSNCQSWFADRKLIVREHYL